MFATGETVGLAEWIIDDTCLVLIKLNKLSYMKRQKYNNELVT